MSATSSKRRRIFWRCAVLIILVLGAMAIPMGAMARCGGGGEKALRNACINNLRQIDGAKEQWALDRRRADRARASERIHKGRRAQVPERWRVSLWQSWGRADVLNSRSRSTGGRSQLDAEQPVKNCDRFILNTDGLTEMLKRIRVETF
jgi:hypothetical protein